MTSVLEGISVLDLSHGVAGPIATMLLADNGAAVTRIESPEPDPFATWPGSRVWARGKRSAVLDLAQADGPRAIPRARQSGRRGRRELPPGVTTRLGIDYDALSARNPRLIYCSITGYGRGNRHSRSARVRRARRRSPRSATRATQLARRADRPHPRPRATGARPRVAAGLRARITALGTHLQLLHVAIVGDRVLGDHRHQRRVCWRASRPAAVNSSRRRCCKARWR